ncbi:hypothetical protein [uncultured Desulfosarcina sp.]|uniref:hypothetical protein n=1 Tax=uncultured Desulfosarcina sp. TaxID=218289 RepID=UPI0029C67F27|nr:hypothetical protein [uncultured Desulfosarcina sp.]
MKTWQIFRAAKKNLPPGVLQSLYTRSSRLIDLWAADPRNCACTARNPIDRIRDMLDAMDTAGDGDYARFAIDYMAEPLGGRFAPFTDGIESDKGTVDGEAVDVTMALSNLVATIRDTMADDRITTAERVRIMQAARIIKDEVDQLLAVTGIQGGA